MYDYAVAQTLVYYPALNAPVIVYWGRVIALLNGRWTTLKTGLAMGGYHNCGEYSPVDNVVYFGGGNGSNDFYKLDERGQVTQLANSPITFGVYSGLLTVDPVSGEALIIGRNQSFHAYNPSSDSWRSLPTAGIPWSGSSNPIGMKVIVPISTYGVIMLLSRDRVDLYKHANPSAVTGSPVKTGGNGLSVAAVPNPFHASVKIAASGQRIADGNIEIAIYNSSGKIIQRLSVTSYQLSAGITWNPTGLPSGVYLLRARINGKIISKRLFLM